MVILQVMLHVRKSQTSDHDNTCTSTVGYRHPIIGLEKCVVCSMAKELTKGFEQEKLTKLFIACDWYLQTPVI